MFSISDVNIKREGSLPYTVRVSDGVDM